LKKYYTLLLLAVLFAAPGLVAWFLYQHPTMVGVSKVNKGILLTPPVSLHAFNNEHKWRLVLWAPKGCGTHCLQSLDKIARIRLALGRKLYSVDQWLLLGHKAPLVSSKTNAFLKEGDFHFSILSEKQTNQLTKLPAENKLFIASPDNYLILAYTLRANSEDVYKDLKLLLNSTEQKNG